MCAICDLNIHFDVEPASALPVALATRRAIEGGRLPAPEFSADPVGDRNPRRLAVRALAGVQQRLEQVHAPEALVALPDFFVLIIESRSWGFFHPTPGGFDPNWTPDAPRIEGAPAERDAIVILSVAAANEANAGRLPLDEALRQGLIVVDADDIRRVALLRAWREAYPESSFSRFACS